MAELVIKFCISAGSIGDVKIQVSTVNCAPNASSPSKKPACFASIVIARLDVTSDRIDSDIITYYEKDGKVLQRRVPGLKPGQRLKEQRQHGRHFATAAAGQGVLSPEITGKVMKAASAAIPDRPTADLSPRESEVLQLVAHGLTTPQIAKQLVLAESTVKTHLRHIMRKLEAANRAEAVARASAQGLLSPST